MKKDKYSLRKPIASITTPINTARINFMIKRFRDVEKLNISFGDIVLYAICRSLGNFKEFNSNFTDKLIFYPNINLGYMVNIEKGAKRIVIKDADKKSIADLSRAIKEKVLKYIRDEPLNSKEYPSFSVTNVSSFNAYIVCPPIYDDQSIMFAIGSEFKSPGVVKGNIKIVKKFNLTLSYDSRAADCQKALEFLNSIKKILEKGEE